MSTAQNAQLNQHCNDNDSTTVNNNQQQSNTTTQNHTTTTTAVMANPQITTALNSDSNLNESLTNSFLASEDVQQLAKDTINKWSELRRKQEETETAITKLQDSINVKKPPPGLTIKLTINLPEQVNEHDKKIKNFINEKNLEIVSMVLEARKEYYISLSEEIKSYISSVQASFTTYVNKHIEQLSAVMSNIDFPKQNVITKYVTNINNTITLKLSESVQRTKRANDKLQKQKEEIAKAEEMVKSNPERSVKQLVDDTVEKKLKLHSKKKRKLEDLQVNVEKNLKQNNTSKTKNKKSKIQSEKFPHVLSNSTTSTNKNQTHPHSSTNNSSKSKNSFSGKRNPPSQQHVQQRSISKSNPSKQRRPLNVVKRK
jgi:hypothetical protein